MNWHCVQTRHKAERTAQHNLIRCGYTVYLPMRWLRSDRCFIPLFPQYLFCLGVPPLGTIGVADVVKFGADPAVVPDSVVETLMISERGWDEKQFKPGDKVEVVGYEGWIGEVLSVDDEHERAYVFLRLLSRRVKTDVSLRRLTAVG